MTAQNPAPAPVLFLAFNRPAHFTQIIDAVRQGGSRDVYVSVDGPRLSHPEDSALCNQVRDLARNIDWATSLQLKFEEENLGCGPAVSSAIAWALDEVSELIILEDDCLPDQSFLKFCDELLARFRDDERVMQIAGTNWGAARERFGKYSYSFTSFAPVWGWATWRRAWALYDYELESWPRMKASGLAAQMPASRRFRRLLHRDWDRVWAGGGTWDHQWQYSVIRHHGLSVCPARNLVKNIGFGLEATQTGEMDRTFGSLPLEELDLPLKHPPDIEQNAALEAVFERIYRRKRGWSAEFIARRVKNPRVQQAVRRVARKLLPRPS